MNQKKFLSTAIACALMVSASTTVWANPLTDVNDPAYVELTAVADNAKAKGEALSAQELEKLAPAVTDLKLVDTKANGQAVALYRYLSAVTKSGKVIYGHENDAHHKMFRPENGTQSDTKDITGSYSGIVGLDALSFVGDEQRMDDCEWNMGKTYVDKMVEMTTPAVKDGDVAKAREEIAAGGKEIGEAHQMQTDLISAECDGQEVEKSVLLIHAQDHFMTALAVRDIANLMVDMYESLKK